MGTNVEVFQMKFTNEGEFSCSLIGYPDSCISFGRDLAHMCMGAKGAWGFTRIDCQPDNLADDRKWFVYMQAEYK